MEYQTFEHDVLVIGAGGAGLRAAIEASAAGVSVGLVCKSLLGKAHTVMAEGGMAASLGNVDDRDGWQTHFADTMRGGQYLNNWRMAELHAKEAPDRVRELESWGAVFDRTKDGLPMFGPLSTCPDVYYGYGYSGSGIILSRLGSKILASLVSEKKDEWSGSGLVRAVGKAFPPEPFRYIGSRFVRAAIERKDNLDHIGRRVGPLTQFWLRFKPSSYKPS